MSSTPTLAVITGGSSGIGLALAERMVARGHHVAIVARDRARLDNARRHLEGFRQDPTQIIQAAAVDVARAEDLSAVIRDAEQQAGPVGVLIAGAGIARPDYFTSLDLADFRELMDTNFFGSLNAAHIVYPEMVARGDGHIVFLASGAAFIGVFGYTAYGASKFALRGLAEALKAEASGTGVKISICYPPDTDTPQLIEAARTKPVETEAISGSGGLWSAGDVADKIIRGMDAGRFQIAPGLKMKALGRLHSLAAPALRWHLDRVAKSARKAGKR
jgi:3-dehydrosphinganine reductase